MPLHAVPHYGHEPGGDDDIIDADIVSDTRSRASNLPTFEGQPVDYALVRLAAVNKLDVGEGAHHIDDMVRVVVEGRVTNVNHVLDPAGKLVRVHTIKVADATQIGWDYDLS